MTVVIKRNKKRERYSRTKLESSIRKAAREARLSAAKQNELVREVAGALSSQFSRRKSIRSTEIRRRVLRRLDTRARSAATAWRRHDRRRSGR